MILKNNVTIGHKAVLHGGTVGKGCLIGINGKNCLIGTNALITEGRVIPDYSLVIGSPGKVCVPWARKKSRRYKPTPRIT